MSLKHDVINNIIGREGGYVNDPNDSGGETRFGITKAVARRYRYHGRMRDLPRSVAFEIYQKRYWDALSLDDVLSIAIEVAEEMADTGVNMGVGRAGRFLQTALNALNNGGALFDDIDIDGVVGKKTIRALSAYITQRGADGVVVLLRMLNSLQGAYYIRLAERRKKDERFVHGWFLNRVS